MKPLILLVFDQLFQGREQVVLRTSHGVIRAKRHFGGPQGNLPGVDIGKYRYVIQNPNTSTKWARMAREGHRIMWAINQRPSKGEEKWAGRVVDGKAFKKVGREWVKIDSSHPAEVELQI